MVLGLQVACFPFEFFKLQNFKFKYFKKIVTNTIFFEMGEPQLLHQNDAYGLLFQLFGKSRQRALHRTYKPEPPNKGIKVQSTNKLVQS
jgi:hypothetical protein